MRRAVEFGKIKGMLTEYREGLLTQTERNLLQGLFKRKLKDSTEALRETLREKIIGTKQTQESNRSFTISTKIYEDGDHPYRGGRHTKNSGSIDTEAGLNHRYLPTLESRYSLK